MEGRGGGGAGRGSVSFQVSACVTFTEVLMVSHVDQPRTVVGQDHLRVWIQEV